MGLKLEKREDVIAAIKAGQRPDGAWSKDAGPSDLSSTYRVMRAFTCSRKSPTNARLLDYIARCRQADGSYAIAPGGPASLGATYFAAIMMRWLRLLDGAPAVLKPAEFAPLFERQATSRAGRETRALWSAATANPHRQVAGPQAQRVPGRPSRITATSSSRCGSGSRTDKGNSGVQFRSVRVPGTEMSGYQADIGENYWGCLYDESRRNRVLVKASAEGPGSRSRRTAGTTMSCAPTQTRSRYT